MELAQHRVREARRVDTEADLRGLRDELLDSLLLVPVGAALFFLYVVFDGARLESWLPIFAFSTVSFAALLARRVSRATSELLLCAGVFLALTATILVYPGLPLLSLYAIVTGMAIVLLGPRYGLVSGALTTAILFALRDLRPEIAPEVVGAAIVLTWAVALLTWFATRPAYTALTWAWYSYADTLDKAEELRDRQGELVSLSKSLRETCLRLEQLNVELARARAAADDARRIKDEFAAAVSHELRTPLNMIIGFSEMMVLSRDAVYDEPLPDGYRTDVEAIHRNACHISNLIDDILDLSQIDAHRMALQREDASLATIVDQSVQSVAGLFHERRLRLVADLPPDLPPVHVDVTRVRQIFLNLLTNAARFTERGGVTISASLRDREVLVAVTDTGIGMAPGDVELAFEPFRQVGDRERFRAGNGLGLAISRRFVEMHGGAMWAESGPGAGTIFWFTLPIGDTAVVAPAPPRWETWMGAQVSGREKTVLAVDPDGDAARLLRRYLDGYRVLAASTPDDVSRVAGQEAVHALVLTSESEPNHGATGASAMLPRVPTITCPFRSTHALAGNLDGVDYLVKPVTLAQLRGALRRIGTTVRSVLVVDDDPDMLRLLERMIRAARRRCRVLVARDGQAGLALLREHRPTLVLLDLLMPGMDGYAFLDEIRNDPELRTTPVIVISARGREPEAVCVEALRVRRDGGFTVGETVRLLRASLDVLTTPAR